MELRHLRYFIAVAEELNFTRAANRLGISQPPLSLQIRQLEKAIGTPLIRRRSRGIELTSAGKLLLEEARTIIKQIGQTKTNVHRRGRGETGRINIGAAGGTYFHPLIPQIICEYRTLYPEIVFAPEDSNTSMLIARLHAGAVDVAFIWPPINDSDDLALEPLVEEDTILLVPSGHPLSGSASVPLAALAKETFVLFPREINPGVYDKIVSACQHAGFNPKLGAEAPQVESIFPLVAAGFGVSIVPSFTKRIRTDGVVFLPLKTGAPRAGISLAYRHDDRQPAVQNFVAIARRVTRARIQNGGFDATKLVEKIKRESSATPTSVVSNAS